MTERKRPKFKVKTGIIGFKDSKVEIEDAEGNVMDISAGIVGFNLSIQYGAVTRVVLSLHPEGVEVDAEGLVELKVVEVQDGGE